MDDSPISIFDTANELSTQVFLKNFPKRVLMYSSENNWLSEQPQQKIKTISGKTLKNKLAKINLNPSEQISFLINDDARFFVADESKNFIIYKQSDNNNNSLTIWRTPIINNVEINLTASEIVKDIL